MDATVRTLRGRVRLEQHGCVLSEVLRHPGPTDSVFDVLAAAVHCFASGPRIALLGFAAGGMIAPLRGLGGGHVVEGVDLSAEGHELFRRTAGEWAGRVRFTQADAAEWLRRRKGPFDGIVEDLSVPERGDVVKPPVAWKVLPALMRRRVARGGVVISNLLPTPGQSWHSLIASCRTGPGVVVELEQFYNRLLLQGRDLGEARAVGRRLREALRAIGSRLAGELRVRGLPPTPPGAGSG